MTRFLVQPLSLESFLARGLEVLKRRGDFLRVAAGRRVATPGLVLQAAPRPRISTGAVRVGFTASRKVGNSVTRNRAKRRMRAAAAKILPYQAKPDTDYVLIARASTVERPFAALVADLEGALCRINASSTASMHKAPRETHQARHQFGTQ